MDQSKLRAPAGAKHGRKRVGRGNGSGHGTFSGRGCKGQKSRSGPNVRLGFEGGQLPFIKRMPEKRGFTNIFKIVYGTVNVGQLKVFSPDIEIGAEQLYGEGMIDSIKKPVKILGDGEIDKPLVVKAQKFSAVAKQKIEAAGGRAEEI